MPSKRPWRWMFSPALVPEVARFDDERELQRLLEQATARPRSILLVLCFVAAIVAIVFLVRFAAGRVGVSPGVAQTIVQPIVMLAGFYWLFNHALRRPFQEALRGALQERGVPICLGCGYDLRGQQTPTCPECRRGFPAELLRTAEAVEAGGAKAP